MRLPNSGANSFGMSNGQMVQGSATSGMTRRKKRMSGITWIFMAMVCFFVLAGVTSQFIRQRRVLPMISAPAAPRSYFGVNSFDTTQGGVTFDGIEAPDSPADKAGLVGGDIITSFDGHAVKDEDELMDLLGSTPVGKTVDIVYVRDGETHTTKLTTIAKGELDALTKAFVSRPQGRGLLGIDDQRAVDIPNTTIRGVVLGTVKPSLPADMAGLKNGDVVIEFGGTAIRTAEELNHRIQRAIPYETTDVVVMRNGERLKIPVKMGRR
jgi:S1-C subfamily serine protease